jgi:hypothetical protein
MSLPLVFPDRPLSPDNPSVWALTTHVEPFNAGSGPVNYAQLAKDPDTLVIGAITRDSNGAASNGSGGAGTGGAGGVYGAGGGGGGASVNGQNSGAGGAGAPGVVVVIST